MSEFVFVTMSHDYSDEFDVDCCFVAKKKDFEEDMAFIREGFDNMHVTDVSEFYFGTNEALQFSSYDEFARGVVVKPCSEQFYNEWFDLTAGSSVGFCVMDSIIEHITEEQDEEGDDE